MDHDIINKMVKRVFYGGRKVMSKFLNGYLIEYICGHTYCTVTSGEVDQFGRFMGKKMVFRSESWEECEEYARTH